MLFTIGLIGMLVTIARCRKPDVAFFSVVTVFNRKDKLTELGEKIYLLFFCLICIGLVIGFMGKKAPPENTAHADVSAHDDGVDRAQLTQELVSVRRALASVQRNWPGAKSEVKAAIAVGENDVAVDIGDGSGVILRGLKYSIDKYATSAKQLCMTYRDEKDAFTPECAKLFK